MSARLYITIKDKLNKDLYVLGAADDDGLIKAFDWLGVEAEDERYNESYNIAHKLGLSMMTDDELIKIQKRSRG